MTSVENNNSEEPERIIGRWTIGKTLGKGGYSWVKRGKDIKTGKIVALKFMEKAGSSWAKEQAAQVETEIEALKAVRHRNIMKLYAYNLNAQYPQAPPKKGYLDTILLVLEYAPGGELFDILYYTKSLEEKICRTYFRQILAGLEACHNAGVVHRDLKPQNLLFDANFNIKITDFGLSKLVRSDADAAMKTTYVGTKGYQAPELLRNETYDLKCDVFSVGVILFILLAGYPPFEQAKDTDKWYRNIIAKNYEKFWHSHRKSPIIKNKMAVTTLLEHMLQSNPKDRATIKDIKKHPWTREETIPARQLIPVLKERHRLAEQKRLKDVRKMTDLAVSVNKNRAVEGLEAKSSVDFLPETEPEVGIHLYTWGNWVSIYNQMHDFVPTFAQGEAEYNFDTHRLECKISVAGNESPVMFNVKLYKSRVWEGKAPKDVIDPENVLDQKKEFKDRVYIVKLELVSGDFHTWGQFKNNFLLTKCANAFKGLPSWALKIGKAEAAAAAAAGDSAASEEQKESAPSQEQANSNSDNSAETELEVEADEYDNVLVKGDIWGKAGAVVQDAAISVEVGAQ